MFFFTKKKKNRFEKCVLLSGHRNQMVRHCAAKAAAALCVPTHLSEKTSEVISKAIDMLLTSTNVAYGFM
jgi:hypothetical protein